MLQRYEMSFKSPNISGGNSVDAEVVGDEAHLAGGVAVAVAVPAGRLQRRYQFVAAVDILAKPFKRGLLMLRVRTVDPRQLSFQIGSVF